MNKNGVIGLIVIVTAIFVGGFFLFVRESNFEEEECVSDDDCVAASCCHPTSCVEISKTPNCSGIFCTMECEPGTLDCNQGSCRCIRGKCNAEIK